MEHAPEPRRQKLGTISRRGALKAISTAVASPLFSAAFPGAADGGVTDPRNIRHGSVIPGPGMKYFDQPYVVRNRDGHWLCMLTTGTLGEVVTGSVNFSAVTLSRDRGRTWTPPVKCSDAAYAVPLQTPSGRVYAIRPPQSFTYSDDGGRTWSAAQPFPEQVGVVGGVRGGWSVSMPLVIGDTMYLAWAKIGLNRPPRDTEVFLYRSDNILSETDPARIHWQRLPGGEVGLRAPDWQLPKRRSEEPHVVSLSGGQLYLVWRTDQGYVGHATSRDHGTNWAEPTYLKYTPDGRRIKHPLACPSLWRCGNGKFLLWIHNHSGTDYADRNPAWVCGGVERGDHIEWSEPEVVLYGDDISYEGGRISYPGFLEEGGHYWIFETQKTLARVHEINPALLEATWNQGSARTVTRDGLALSLRGRQLRPGATARMPRLPRPDAGGGFSLDLWLRLEELSADQVVLDARDQAGRGIWLRMTGSGTLRLELSDGRRTAGWDCDPGLLRPGTLHHVVFIVDGGPKLMTVVVDGKLCDGGAHRQHGYGRIDGRIPGSRPGEKVSDQGVPGDLMGAPRLRLATSLKGEIRSLRIYTRYLLTSEAVGNYRAGP